MRIKRTEPVYRLFLNNCNYFSGTKKKITQNPLARDLLISCKTFVVTKYELLSEISKWVNFFLYFFCRKKEMYFLLFSLVEKLSEVEKKQIWYDWKWSAKLQIETNDTLSVCNTVTNTRYVITQIT